MQWNLPSILELGRQIRVGETSPLHVLETCLARIRDQEADLRAWVFVDEENSRRQAEALGTLLKTGADLGPLHGIPLGIKDIVDVAGWPTLAGSILRAGHVARHDAVMTARLRRAGAIVMGKTVTTEFACFDPPPTRNPWNREHTPGGSSSGSAAATAREMCLLAVGSQTGGSIIRPASFCGVAGLKPTHGKLSLDGIVPISSHLDHPGPIARFASDLAVGYAAMSGEPSPEWFPSRCDSEPRLALIEAYFFEQADEEVGQITRAAINALRSKLAVATLDLPPSFANFSVMHKRLMAIDAAAYHRADFARKPEAFGRHVRALIEEGLRGTGVEYSEALEHQRRFRRELASLWPDGWIAVMPSTPTVAPGRDTTGDPKFNAPWSYCGFPTVTIPCGLSRSGLPCGLQLAGKPNCEWHLLAAAIWCERRLAFHPQVG